MSDSNHLSLIRGDESVPDEAVMLEIERRRNPLAELATARRRASRGIRFDFGPIGELLDDPTITEIMINGPGEVWIERAGVLSGSGLNLEAADINLLVERIVGPLGLRVDRSSPLVDARLPGGIRASVVVPPVALAGVTVSLRILSSLALPLECFGPNPLQNLITELTCTPETTLIVGPTSSGKTSLLASMLALVPVSQRIVCIEDTAEIVATNANMVRLESRPPNAEGVGEVTLRHLTRAALRLRPDRIVVGEVRGAEALDLLIALTAGHRGSLATCHAHDAAEALDRLAVLACLGSTQLTPEMAATLVRQAFDVVIEVCRDGAGERKVKAVKAIGSKGVKSTLWKL